MQKNSYQIFSNNLVCRSRKYIMCIYICHDEMCLHLHHCTSCVQLSQFSKSKHTPHYHPHTHSNMHTDVYSLPRGGKTGSLKNRSGGSPAVRILEEVVLGLN